nr:putative E3 ubiquitin-protein ligase RF298 [Ipomoea batatas]
MAVELEKLLIPLIKEASRTAIKKITECGCSEEEAEWAVLTSGIYQGYMDLINNIINGAFALLDTSIRSLFDDLESLAGYILLEMGVKPFLSSVGEDSMYIQAVAAACSSTVPGNNATCWELRGVKNRNGEAVSIHCLPVVNYKAQSD